MTARWVRLPFVRILMGSGLLLALVICFRLLISPLGLSLLLLCMWPLAYLIVRRWVRRRLWRLLLSALLGLLLGGGLFFGRAMIGVAVYMVPTGSMLPTIPLNSLILVDTWVPSNQLARCDIVAFSYQQQVMIKRLVALPGDKVEVAGNAARINGHESTCLGPIDAAPPVSVQPKTSQLRADEFFMLGDNRRYSSDSRVFGPVRQKALLGRVTWVWHP